jgi:hypothetical protein
MNWNLPITSGTIVNALFLDFLCSDARNSGFESSANFVEEQQQGVFPKLSTCGNREFFNPVIALLLICIIPMALSG